MDVCTGAPNDEVTALRAQAAEMVLLRIEHVSRVDEIYDNETRSILLVV